MAGAFSRHLAAAAAGARHMADAARAAAGMRRDRADEEGDTDIEQCISSSSSSSGDASNDIADAGDNGNGAGGNAGDNGGGDDGSEDMIAVLEHSYELFGVLLGIGTPVPFYFALPEETRAGAAWVWTMLTYAVAVTVISARVFRSRCCLSTMLRALLLIVCLVAEVFAAFHLLPTSSSTFAVAGAGFSIFHLVFAYLVVWAYIRR